MLVVNSNWLSFSAICASCRRTMHRKHIDYTSYPRSVHIGAYIPTHHHVGNPPNLSLFCGFHQGGHPLVLHVVSLCARSWVCDRRLGCGLSEMPSHASAPLPQNCKMYFTLESVPFSVVQLRAAVLGWTPCKWTHCGKQLLPAEKTIKWGAWGFQTPVFSICCCVASLQRAVSILLTNPN